MRIALLSDLHAEFQSELPTLGPDIDVIVLAGDCHSQLNSLALAADYHRRYQVPVILVAGNHEFYGADIGQLLAALRAGAAELDGVFFLENEGVTVQGVRFLGCTLWSDFLLNGEQRAAFHGQRAAALVPDFRLIEQAGELLTPAQVAQRSNDSYRWLDAELAQPFPGATVVITHFAPHRAAIHPQFQQPGTDDLTPYFTRDCSALMCRHEIAAWLFGHTHGSLDVVVDGTRLVANQRGYPGESTAYTQFDPQKVIVLNAP